jgi:hypothetical protein
MRKLRSKSSRRAIRAVLIEAVTAAKYGLPPEAEIVRSIATGDRALSLDAFEFDSLAWMEFCISVEEQSGQELTPEELVDMRHFFEIEEWLVARA